MPLPFGRARISHSAAQAVVRSLCTVRRIFPTASLRDPRRRKMKILLWIIVIIFLIGLLTVTGVLKLIF